MLLLIGSFIAGMLTVLAPCVLPLLPIIIGGSLSGNTIDRKRPLLIALSLSVSLFIFTLLLKATTVLIDVSPSVFTYISGGIIVILGLLTLFPDIYTKILVALKVEPKAQQALGKGMQQKNPYLGSIITGAALGPVFSSCSPVYAYILATVLPVNFSQAMAYITAYILGLAAVLLAIGYYGQRFVSKIKFASDPKGTFQRVLGVIFVAVGLLIITGYDKKFQTWVSVHTPFNIDGLSSTFLPESRSTNSSELFNVEPYDAPELAQSDDWINSEPLSLDGLKGKVVLVDFWTYSCINCIRNNPYLAKWYDTYKDLGFVVVGVHAPEFSFERNKANVEKAVREQNIPYPVVLDNDFKTWAAFQNRSWPASYLIDAQGKVRRVHEGEGKYDEEEQAIRALLEENGKSTNAKNMTVQDGEVPVSSRQTPETYVGSARASNFQNDKALAAQPVQTFVPATDLPKNFWTLGGTWEVQEQKIIARGNSILRFHVSAKEVYAVMGSEDMQAVRILLNNQPISSQNAAGADVKNDTVVIQEYKLYRLVNYQSFRDDGVIELQVPDGVELNAFTFGS